MKKGFEKVVDKDGLGSTECLGIKLCNSVERREYYQNILKEKLADPDYRSQDGLPIGSDEAILEMSDPPYYTACPNPWLKDFVRERGKPYDPNEEYSREPIAIDVSVGKGDPIYKAHSYHTKVPHLAIVPSILHYTDPGDVVLDAFAGSGMTGVATQWCDIAPDRYRHALELEWKSIGKGKPKWGQRSVILNDLSPAATFMAANYCIPFDVNKFELAGKKLLADVNQKIGWMYETLHTDKTVAKIQYTIWSEVFTCRSCTQDIIHFHEALDLETKMVSKIIPCPHCDAKATKEQMDLVFENYLDPLTGEVDQRPKRVPTLIVYSVGKRVFSKKPDKEDIDRLRKIERLPAPSGLPLCELPDCQMTRTGRMATTNTKSVHHMFITRASHAMSTMWRAANSEPDIRIRAFLKFMIEQAIWGISILNRYRPRGFSSHVNDYQSGVFYVPSYTPECSPWHILDKKLKRLVSAFHKYQPPERNSAISTGTASDLPLPSNSIDYIFTDPPFGENIYYADLNLLVESWHGVRTNAGPEAIVDRVRKKSVLDYQKLMVQSFSECYRVLKPGRWMTIVFSNSRASVWNALQVSLQQAGFVVAEVNALDKIQGSFQQVVSPNTVKQDLVISAYKPNSGLEQRLKKRGNQPESAWDFVDAHLKRLPITKLNNETLEIITERDPRRIFDRMVAWFVRHGLPVPLSTESFVEQLRTRYLERDGMIFLPSQVDIYDRRRAQVIIAPQIELFVSDERSAIDWLTEVLRKKPSTYQELHPKFTAQVGAGWRKHEERPDLAALLEDNFLRYEGEDEIPSQIHSYLSSNFKDLRNLSKDDERLIRKARSRWYVPDPKKAMDLSKRRERILLKEFSLYRNSKAQNLKEFRLEVVRLGFRNAWNARDYNVIIEVAERLPERVLLEDEKLLLWYDLARTREEDKSS